MITVMLKDGNTISVSKGKNANYVQTTRNVYHDEVIETNLEVKDKDGYGGATVASFKANEVIAFFIEDEEAREGEE